MAGKGETEDHYTTNGKAFLAQLAAIKSKPYVKIGVLQEQYDVPKETAKQVAVVGKHGPALKPIYDADELVTLGIVAVANEFGTDRANGQADSIFGDVTPKGASANGARGAGVHVPERSFIRSTVDAKKNGEWRIAAEALRKEMIEGRMTTDRALGLMGLRIKKDIQEKIRSQVPPPNAPSTIAAKGSDHPLINTGQLLNSIDFEVHREGENK